MPQDIVKLPICHGQEGKAGLDGYFRFYNTQRPHEALTYRAPAEVYNGDLAEQTEEAKRRWWFPTIELVDFAEPAGLSFNPALILS